MIQNLIVVIFLCVFLLCLVIVGGALAFILKVNSLFLYILIYLIIFSIIYFKKDDYLDRTFPFLVSFLPWEQHLTLLALTCQ